MASNNSNDLKWFAIIIAGCFGGMALMVIFTTDPISERIAACMTQSGMQYVGDDCVPVQSN
jgi:hypothetical protein